jgi:hypothetical protein
MDAWIAMTDVMDKHKFKSDLINFFLFLLFKHQVLGMEKTNGRIMEESMMFLIIYFIFIFYDIF